MPKWKSYSATDKLSVCASIKYGESQASVSCDDKKLHDLEDTANSTEQMKRKIARTAKYPWLDKVVFT